MQTVQKKFSLMLAIIYGEIASQLGGNMSSGVKIQLPEILCASSCALLISGLSWQGWVFLGMGIFGALLRTSLAMQESKLAKEKVESSANILAEGAREFVDALKKSGNDSSRFN